MSMSDKDIAEITARIVVSAIESGRIPSVKAEDVVQYYAKIHKQVATSADEYTASRHAQLNNSST